MQIKNESKTNQPQLEMLIGLLEDSIKTTPAEKPKGIPKASPSQDFSSLTNEISELYKSLIPSTSICVLLTYSILDKLDDDKQQKSMDKISNVVTELFNRANFHWNFWLQADDKPRLFLFGSAAQGFRFRNGDLDICLVVRKNQGGINTYIINIVVQSHMIKQLAHALLGKDYINK